MSRRIYTAPIRLEELNDIRGRIGTTKGLVANVLAAKGPSLIKHPRARAASNSTGRYTPSRFSCRRRRLCSLARSVGDVVTVRPRLAW
jgi:hypothetical protein